MINTSKNKMKKIIIISLLFITIASAFYNCFAFEIGTKELVLLKECERYLKYQGNERIVPFVVYRKDGKTYPAYCINPEYLGIGTHGVGEYSVDGSTRLENEVIWKTIINGYPYKSLAELGVETAEEAYTATKMAVFTVIESNNPADYTAENTEAGRRTLNAYLKIVNDAKNSKDVLKDNNKISITSSNKEWEVDPINNKYVSKTYNINAIVKNGTYKIEIEGNIPQGIMITNTQNNIQSSFKVKENFKILIPINSLVENNSFKIKATADLETKPIIYGKTSLVNRQNYAISGYMQEESRGNIEEKYLKNITKIEIIKKEYGTDNRLHGVKFNLLNANKDIIMQDLVTNENGEIVIDKLYPEKYYIQETETLPGFNLYKDLIEIDIKLNEEVQVIVNNTVKTISELSNKKDIVEVIQNSTETVHNVDEETTIYKNNNVKKLPITGY